MSKTLRIISWILGSVFVLILGISVFIYLKADDIVASYINRAIEKQPLPGHKIGYSSFHLSLRKGSLEVDSLYIVPDEQDTSYVEGGYTRLNLAVANVHLSSIGVFNLIGRRVIRAGDFQITHPEVEMVMGRGWKKNDTKKDDDETSEVAEEKEKKKKPPIRKIILSNFELSNGDILVFDKNDKDTLYIGKRLDLIFRDIHYDFIHKEKLSKALSLKDMEFAAYQTTLVLPGKFYRLEFDSLGILFEESSLSLDSLKLIPQYSKKQFGVKFGRQMDRFDVSVDRIAVSGLDIERIIDAGAFVTDKVEIVNARADIYRDKNIPRKNEKIKPLLNEMVLHLKTALSIDSLQLTNAYVKYSELPEGQTEPGFVSIDHFDLLATNVTNLPEEIAANSTMDIMGNFLLEGKGQAKIDISFPLDDASKNYHYTLELGEMPLTLLNPMLKHGANLEVIDGTLTSSRFKLLANSDSAYGKAYMRYHDLKMNVMKKNKPDKDRLSEVNKFFSSLANALIRSDNPSKKNDVERVGIISFERDKYKSNIGYLVKPLISGIIQILAPGDLKVEKIDHSDKEKK